MNLFFLAQRAFAAAQRHDGTAHAVQWDIKRWHGRHVDLLVLAPELRTEKRPFSLVRLCALRRAVDMFDGCVKQELLQCPREGETLTWGCPFLQVCRLCLLLSQ